MKAAENMNTKRKTHRAYRMFILSIAILLIILLTVGIFTYRNYPNDGWQDNVELSENDIYMKNTNQDETFPPEQVENKEETATEATSKSQKAAAIYIPQTKSLLFDSQSAMDVRMGKVYYRDDNGKLESYINHDENEVREDLYSYDSYGNQIDKLEIGYAYDGAEYFKCAIIFKNKISIYEKRLSADYENEEIVTEYLILPNLKFSRGETYTKF